MKIPLPKAVKLEIKNRLQSAADLAARDAVTGLRETLESLHREVKSLSEDARDAAAAVQQWEGIWRHEGAWAPPPPKHLQIRVVGGYVPGFIESGYSICEDLNAALKVVGKTLSDFPRILDYGCGCGRLIRAMKSLRPEADLYGTDIDAEAIQWLTANYRPFGQFAVAPHLPPTPYRDGMFDLVAGMSVFTHLPEDMQFAWLRELQRITRPGGYLILSTHGEKHYKTLPGDAPQIMESKGFFYSDFGFNYGKSISLPDFYQTTFHSHDYLRREWGKYFEVLDIQTLRLQQHQDTILLRNGL